MDYLLEIGTEELPSSYIEGASKDLEDKFVALLQDHRLKYSGITSFSTPRRLAILISDLDEFEEAKTIDQRGPSEDIAFDENGQASKALEGFIRSQGVSMDDIVIKDSYVYVSKTEEALSVREIFKEEVPNLISKINFPRTMVWHSNDFSFARPIRWILSLYGEEVLDLNIGQIPVSNKTRGHRFLGSQEVEINRPNTYEGRLKANYVIPDPVERREMIKSQAEILASQNGGIIKNDQGLLDELVNIVEYPTAILGSIKEEYLILPSIVITTTIREHLRFIPLYEGDDSDKLLPYFISIVNGTADSKDTIIKGNEKVLGARLQDAKFFYEDDLKMDLEALVPKLDRIIYQDKLGTMKDRVDRLVYLVEQLGSQLSIADAANEDVKRAAYLSKSDLLTGLVNEFPELQGTMGAIYAKTQGESKLVYRAIGEQYLPKHAGGDLPDSTVGSILSMADKLDAICGMFAIGLTPTGSQDPYGLRRAAIGVINIILDQAWNIDLNDSIDSSLYAYIDKNALVYDYEDVKKQILDFFKSRIRVNLLDSRARYDIVDAILALDGGQVLSIYRKVDQLGQWLEKGQESSLESLKRINNIAGKHGSRDSYDPNIFNEYEKNLNQAFENFKARVDELGLSIRFSDVLVEMEKLSDPISAYFDNVLVFDDDQALKDNRLGFLTSINSYIKENIFDFSKIVE